MELKSKEIVERFKQKIPLIKNVDHTIYGITQLDIISADKKTIKQYVLAFERLKVIEPPTFLTEIYADVYIRIKDENLLKIATKEVSLDEAIKQKLFKFYGDKEIFEIQLKALRQILPNEEFTNHRKDEFQETTIQEIDKDFRNEEFYKRTDLSAIPPQLKFLADAMEKLHKRFSIRGRIKYQYKS